MSGASPPPRPDLPRGGVVLVHGLDGRPSATWRWWEAIAVYLGAFLVGTGVSVPVFRLLAPEGLATVAASMVASLVVAGLLVAWLRTRHPAWTSAVGFPWPPWRDVRAGLLFGIGLYPAVVFVVGALLVALFRLVTGQQVQAPDQLPSDLGPIGAAVAVLYAGVVAPVSEELFFRGVLFRSIRDRHGFWAGALASSVLFGLIHYVPAPALDALLLMTVMVFTGLGLSLVYERRGSLWAPIAAHATFNAIGLGLIFALR